MPNEHVSLRKSGGKTLDANPARLERLLPLLARAIDDYAFDMGSDYRYAGQRVIAIRSNFKHHGVESFQPKMELTVTFTGEKTYQLIYQDGEDFRILPDQAVITDSATGEETTVATVVAALTAMDSLTGETW